MNLYKRNLSFKTRFLNFLRKIFTIPPFEKLLLKFTLDKHNSICNKLIPPNYLYKPQTFRQVRRNGINYHLDISNVVDHYLYYGLNEDVYSSIQEEIKRAAVIFDIGANIGSTALYFAQLNPAAKVFAFEPDAATFKSAQKNILLNSTITNISLQNLALGAVSGNQKLYEVDSHNPGMNRILADADYPFKIINVESLDSFINKHGIAIIDFIKIDVEGYEYEVLKGAITALTKYHPIILMELDDTYLKENNRSAKEVVALLTESGYNKIYKATDNTPLSINSDFKNCHFDIIAKQS